jgi:NAD(P)H-dependent FMN reductase
MLGHTAPSLRIAVIVGDNRQDSINRKLAQALVRLSAPNSMRVSCGSTAA